MSISSDDLEKQLLCIQVHPAFTPEKKHRRYCFLHRHCHAHFILIGFHSLRQTVCTMHLLLGNE